MRRPISYSHDRAAQEIRSLPSGARLRMSWAGMPRRHHARKTCALLLVAQACLVLSSDNAKAMSDRSYEFRKAANECLELARNTTDATTRVSLLTMAQKWFDLANGPARGDRLNTILRDFNDDQMSSRTGSKPVLQQQQQVQPKKEK
jgi:hypothetical protein